MPQIDPQVKTKIEEIVEDINDTMLELNVLTNFVLYSRSQRNRPYNSEINGYLS